MFDTQSGAPVAGPTLVLTQLRAGQTDKAAKVAEALVKRDAKNPLFQTLMGMVKAGQDDVAGAETAFRAALARSARFCPCHARPYTTVFGYRESRAERSRVYNDAFSPKSRMTESTLQRYAANIAMVEKKWPGGSRIHSTERALRPPTTLRRARARAQLRTAPGLDQRPVCGLRTQRPIPVEYRGNGCTWEGLSSLPVTPTGQFPASSVRTNYARVRCRSCRAIQTLLNAAKYYGEERGVLQDAIAKDPKNASLKANLARVTAQIDGIDAGIAQANSFAKDDPNNNIYSLAAAELYQNAGRYERRRGATRKGRCGPANG